MKRQYVHYLRSRHMQKLRDVKKRFKEFECWSAEIVQKSGMPLHMLGNCHLELGFTDNEHNMFNLYLYPWSHDTALYSNGGSAQSKEFYSKKPKAWLTRSICRD